VTTQPRIDLHDASNSPSCNPPGSMCNDTASCMGAHGPGLHNTRAPRAVSNVLELLCYMFCQVPQVPSVAPSQPMTATSNHVQG